MTRPDTSEYAPYFGRYVDLIVEPDIFAVLEAQIDLMRSLASHAGAKELFAYAPGKWTVRFHFNEICCDVNSDSPHGHAAFFVNVP